MSANRHYASSMRIFRFLRLRLGLIVIAALAGAGMHTRVFAEDAMFRIGVNANFDAGDMRVTEVEKSGPATQMRDSAGKVARMERGDTVVAIDSRPIRSHADFVASVNQSLDGELAVVVRDVNTGREVEWMIEAKPTARTAFEAARDAYNRALRNDAIMYNRFVFDVRDQYVMTTLTSTLRPMIPERDTLTPDEMLRQTIVGTQVIRLHEVSRSPQKVFKDDDFSDVDLALGQAFENLSQSTDEERRRQIAMDAHNMTHDLLQAALSRWAEANGRRLLEEATVPVLIEFLVRTSIPGTRVQLLSVGDKIAVLMGIGESPRAITDRGKAALDDCSLWNTLLEDRGAAYGRYHYRLVDQAGNVVKQPDYSSRSIMRIVERPPGGEIRF